jgi:hypothetical protein
MPRALACTPRRGGRGCANLRLKSSRAIDASCSPLRLPSVAAEKFGLPASTHAEQVPPHRGPKEGDNDHAKSRIAQGIRGDDATPASPRTRGPGLSGQPESHLRLLGFPVLPARRLVVPSHPGSVWRRTPRSLKVFLNPLKGVWLGLCKIEYAGLQYQLDCVEAALKPPELFICHWWLP